MTQPSKNIAAPTQRDSYWDAVRAILILTVIWIHLPSGSLFQGTDFYWNFDLWVMARQLLNFPVAIFLFLAGYFVVQSKVSPQWIKGRAKRLLIPFFVWSLLYGLIFLLFRDAYETPVEFIVSVVTGQTAVQLYFILVLIQLILLTPLVLRLLQTRWAWTMFLITPIYILWMYIFAIQTGEMPALYGTIFAGWSAFYFAGLWLKNRPVRLPPIRAALAIGAAAILLLAGIVEAFGLLVSGITLQLAISQLSITSILYAFAIIAVVFAVRPRIKDKAIPDWMVKLGRISYGVYFVHLVWIIVLAPLSIKILEVFPVLAVVQLAMLVVVTLLSVVSIVIVRRLIGKKAAASIFGF